jgi:sugar phosphate isomerase/epimerase
MKHTLTLLTVLLLAGSVYAANPFFAMDTAVRNLDELDTVKQLGYAGIGWKGVPPEQLAADVKRVQEHGLKLFAIYTGATLTKSNLTWSPHLEADMVALKSTGAAIWMPINSKDFPRSSPEGDQVAVPDLLRLSELAAASGLRVAIYPHTGCWAERVQDAVRLAKKVNRKNFGVTFNLCHCLKVGDEVKIPELLAEAGPHLFLVTINGADKYEENFKWDRLIRPLDEGSYDVGIVLRKLKELNYTGPIGLQAFGLKIPVKESLTRSMNGWRKLNP